MNVDPIIPQLEMQWLPIVGRLVISSVIVISATWIVTWRLGHSTPAIRHRVLLMGVLWVLLLPLLVGPTDQWGFTVHLDQQSHAVVRTEPPVPTSSEHRRSSTAEIHAMTPSFSSASERNEGKGAGPMMPAKETQGRERFSEVEPLPVVAAASDGLDRKDGIVKNKRSLTSLPMIWWLMVVWWAVSLVLLLRVGWHQVSIWRIVRRSLPVNHQDVLLMVHSMIDRQHLGRSPRRRRTRVRLRCSHDIDVPIAAGVFRHWIVLPAGYGRWPADRLRVVLLHELEHVHRFDVLAQLIARLACALYWFNPMVWKAATRMRVERELACDDSLLVMGEDPIEYARHLVGVASGLRKRSCVPEAAAPMAAAPLAAAPMAAPSALHQRVQRLVQGGLDRSGMSASASHGLWIFGLMTLGGLTVVSPSMAVSPGDGARSDERYFESEVVLTGDLPRDWLERLLDNPRLRELTLRSPGANFKASRLSKLVSLLRFRAEDFPLESPLGDVVLAHVARLPEVRSLEFVRTGLTDRGMKKLEGTSVAELSLIGEEMLTDDAFFSVGKMPSLRALKLESTPIEANGLEHLRDCPELRSLAIEKDLGATARLPVIARLPKLTELVLWQESFSDMVVLRNASSLRRLTLKHCGAFHVTKSLSQLTQLNELRLENADLRNESFEDVRSGLAQLGIEVTDSTPVFGPRAQGQGAETDEATALACKVHDELDMAKRCPSFRIRWRANRGEVLSMTREPIRTIHRLKKALDEASLPAENGFGASESQLAWSSGQVFSETKYLQGDHVVSERYTFGDREVAMLHELSERSEPVHVIRKGVSKFADSIDQTPPSLQISPQSYWWGQGADGSLGASSFLPESVRYQELPSESFA
ncbi:MAG: M56 family metallopeptidase, partial [Planctomycetota bacterium]